jgi:hypothetical protein
VEVLVEEQQVPPLRIVAELGRGAGDRSMAVGVRQPDRDEPGREVPGDVTEPHPDAGPGRVLDGEVGAERLVPAHQRLDEQVVDREPDRAAPVRVAAEQAGRRLAGS